MVTVISFLYPDRWIVFVQNVDGSSIILEAYPP